MVTGIVLTAQQGERLVQQEFDELDPALDAYRDHMPDVAKGLEMIDLIAYIDGVLHVYQGDAWRRVH